MSYLDLNNEAITDSKGKVSFRILEHICNNSSIPIRFFGDGINSYFEFSDQGIMFKNLVYVRSVFTTNFLFQLPDLVSADYIFYYTNYYEPFDICKLKKTKRFYMKKDKFDSNILALDLINTQIKIIDENTLIINGKELIVEEYWDLFDFVNYNNYTDFDFY